VSECVLDRTVDTNVEGSFGGQSGVDDCIERIAESINYAHSRVEKVVTGFTEICLFLNEICDSGMTPAWEVQEERKFQKFSCSF